MSAQLTHQGIQAKTMQPTTPAGAGPLRRAWHQIHLSMAETNYAARRLVELQAPWAIDEQWHTR